MVSFLTQIPECDTWSRSFGFIFFLTLVFVLLLSFHWEIRYCVSFYWVFLQTQEGLSLFIAKIVSIFVLIGTDFVIIWEVFCGRISLDSVLLLLILNFAKRTWLELMYVSLIINIRSSLIYLFNFWHFVRLPHLIEIT